MEWIQLRFPGKSTQKQRGTPKGCWQLVFTHAISLYLAFLWNEMVPPNGALFYKSVLKRIWPTVVCLIISWEHFRFKVRGDSAHRDRPGRAHSKIPSCAM
jgi:hypothetical protein